MKTSRKFYIYSGRIMNKYQITLNIINFVEVMKKFWKCFFRILMTFVKKCEILYKFLSILMEILYFFYISFWKNF